LLASRAVNTRPVTPLRLALPSVLALVAFVALTLPALAQGRSLPDSFGDLADKLVPAVVNISTTQAMPEKNGEKDSA
jgi:serine protease Do